MSIQLSLYHLIKILLPSVIVVINLKEYAGMRPWGKLFLIANIKLSSTHIHIIQYHAQSCISHRHTCRLVARLTVRGEGACKNMQASGHAKYNVMQFKLSM